MLTRSPVQTGPANASSPRNSFHAFHYAPVTSSPHRSPSARVTAAGASTLHRRKSSSSLPGSGTASSSSSAAVKASPSVCPPPPPKQQRYVGVDASTQYSPMDEPSADAVTAATGSAAAVVSVSQSSSVSGRETAAVQEQKLSGLSQEKPLEPAKAAISTSATTAPSTTVPIATPGLSAAVASHAISPNKRRNSEAQREAGSTSESIVTGSPKRVRAEAAPPKILPQRYEFCQVEDVVVLIANMLCELIETNDALALKSGHLTRFHSR